MKVFQVGVGSGGVVVLDQLIREPGTSKIVLIDPDVYQARNVYRHLFPPFGIGKLKVDLAVEWVAQYRPDLEVMASAIDITDATQQKRVNDLVAECDIGVCAVDNEYAKYHFDSLMRQHRKPWTLGEVLSGGIGGWVHRFSPAGPCYGCVSSYLNREAQTERDTPPIDYADPESQVREASVPASWNSVGIIAGLHAKLTLDLATGIDWDCTSLLFALSKVEGIFASSMQPFKFRIARSPDCFICGLDRENSLSGDQLDVALDQALAKLAHG